MMQQLVSTALPSRSPSRHGWARLSMVFLIGIGILAGCASDPRQQADALGQQAGLVREQIAAPPFVLTSYVRITRNDQPLTVYIEGDGLAWRSRYQPSDDPTPRQALGLRLAAADHSANVVYLARPCQFTAITDDPRCNVTYWTGKRFAPEVVTAMDAAVSRYAARVPGQPVNLVGYSGGGAIAVLVAARRQDIATLRTVAGNLDHDAVNRRHRVTPMPDSLNPIDVVDRVAGIAQVHFSGTDDSVVPTTIARSFVAKAGPCATLRIVDGLSHEGDWARQWPQMLAIQPSCHSASGK